MCLVVVVVVVRVRLLMSLLFVLVVVDDVACVWCLFLSLFGIGVLVVGVVRLMWLQLRLLLV